MAVVHSNDGVDISPLSRVVQAALSSQSSVPSILTYLQELLGVLESDDVNYLVNLASNYTLDAEKLMEMLYSAQVNATIAEHAFFTKSVLGLEAGQNALIANGKACGKFYWESSSSTDHFCHFV